MGDDPYKAPTELEPLNSFPTHTCPACKVPITRWATLKQPTPFRFKCGSCKTKFRVQTPHMGLLVAVLGSAFGLLFFGSIALGKAADSPILLPVLAAGVTAWVFELFLHRHIARNGRFLTTPKRGEKRWQARREA